jgi:hypothetical protein
VQGPIPKIGESARTDHIFKPKLNYHVLLGHFIFITAKFIKHFIFKLEFLSYQLLVIS